MKNAQRTKERFGKIAFDMKVRAEAAVTIGDGLLADG